MHKKYTKEDFIAKKHGSEREPWVQKQMPFPAKKLKSKEEEHYKKLRLDETFVHANSFD